MIGSTRNLSLWLPASALVLTALAAACGGAPVPDEAKASDAPATSEPPFDPCKDSDPLKKTYKGLLKKARCDQDVYFQMARVAGQLGVECSYCHAPKEGSADGKETDYPKMTDMKQKALFMGHAFLDGLVRKDKKETQCSDCHVDKAGKPAPKFLGTPRDKAFTLDWMNLRLVNDFVTKDGGKLKCKHCHVAAYGMPGFEPKVILGDKNPSIPGVSPFVRFEEVRDPPTDTSAAPPASAATPTAPPTGAAPGPSAPAAPATSAPATPSSPKPP